MLKLEGTIKKIEVEEYTKKDGVKGSKRWVYIDCPNRIYPAKVEISNNDIKIGKEGDKISLNVGVDAYYWVDKTYNKAKYKLYASKYN